MSYSPLKRFLLLVFSLAIACGLSAFPAFAAEKHSLLPDATGSFAGLAAVGLFILAYALVMTEELHHLRKSKPVLIAAAAIWALLAVEVMRLSPETGAGLIDVAFRETFLEFAELFAFLLVAMTYVNAMTERQIFALLRAWLIEKRFGYRAVFWITGLCAFILSPFVDNMTTALIMGAVVIAVGKNELKFVALCCINIVVAANASGAFSPFGDVTTLMVWQHEILPFFQFFDLFLPSIVNWLVPAVIMSLTLPKGLPEPAHDDAKLLPGAKGIVILFGFTIATTVSAHQFFHLPAVYGMMAGLGYLQIYGYYLQRRHYTQGDDQIGQVVPFDVFRQVALAEWDTLLFFYGVVLAVGGLATFGYLTFAAHHMYGALGDTGANVLVGVLSAFVDNIPIMFAVLTMHPPMDAGQWLLVTLTAGVGGSMLSIGSAAGVALMGQARQAYTFSAHLKWAWAVALGYALSILCHMWLNGADFTGIPLQP